MSHTAKQVLVTGGAGFIGSHSVELLLERGFHVRVLDNLSSGKGENLPKHSNIEFIEGDIRDARLVTEAMRGISHCLHLAAQVSVSRSIEDPVESAEHNIIGTLNVMQAAWKNQIARLVYASSAAVYGTPDRLPLTEQDATRPLTPYGLEKWIDEQYAARMRDMHGLSSLGLRYFNVYGPRQDPSSPYAGVISRFLDCLQTSQAPSIYGDGRQTRDFIYVGDIAQANVAALTSQHQGVCNVATGKRIDLLTLLALLQEQTGCYLPASHSPQQTGDIRDSCGDIQRLRSWLGFEPRCSLAEGLGALIQSTKMPSAMASSVA